MKLDMWPLIPLVLLIYLGVEWFTRVPRPEPWTVAEAKAACVARWPPPRYEVFGSGPRPRGGYFDMVDINQPLGPTSLHRCGYSSVDRQLDEVEK